MIIYIGVVNKVDPCSEGGYNLKKAIQIVCLGILAGMIATVAVSAAGGENFLYSILKIKENKEQMIEDVRQSMLEGKEIVTVKYIGKRENIKSVATAAVEQALEEDDPDTSSDFDYLKHKYRGYTATMKGIAFYGVITYHFSYSETKEQTDWVDKRVKKIILGLNFGESSDYEKIKKIHDYIVDNVSYDITVQFNSAYEGLHSKVTACEGYSNLAYKMFTEAGIPSRVITGTANGEAHAWNIVEINGLWYNIDCTWDDPIGGGSNVNYNYFLKSNYEFPDHIRDEEYENADFNLKYKMAVESWKN